MAASSSAREAPRYRRGAGALLLLVVALALCSCGKSNLTTRASASTSTTGRKAPRGAGVPASAAAVIEGWANALRAGHPKRAAAYWAHPSVMVNSADSAGQIAVLRIDSARGALIADDTLSCGATLSGTSRDGEYVHAEFTLSIRKGAGASSSGCSGPAAVDFLIRKKHIVRWLRAPTTSSAPEKSSESSESAGGAIS